VAGDKAWKTLTRGDVINGRYEIVRGLGDGLLGATYLAKHLASEKHVAIKFLHAPLVRFPKDRERLETAFRSAKGVKHDGIIRYGELGNFESTVFFTQEYYKAQSLRELMNEYLKEGKAFTLQEACQITIKILEAIQYLHDKEMVHRNLKPENVLIHTKPVGPGGQVVRTVKLTDVALADIVNPSIFAEGYVSREEARYLAPELAGFGLAGSSASDLYALGVILYELLVGQPPRGTYLSPTQLRSDLPDHIDDIVEVAMAADAADRYPTPQDMLNDIQQSFQGLIMSEKPRTSLKNIMMGLGVALVVVTVAGMYATTITPEQQKKSATELAAEADDRIRARVAKQTKMPVDLKKMSTAHADMLFIPEGPFVKGRLKQESMHRKVMRVKMGKDGKATLGEDGKPVLKETGQRKPVASQSEPLHQVVQVPGFYIDRYEFPNQLKGSSNAPNMPTHKVTWQQATDSCAERGKRLCTEEEWEKSCKGPENEIYGYLPGNEYDLQKCGDGVDEIHHLGQMEECVSGYGVADMSGNLREWTDSKPGAKEGRRLVKGGLRSNNVRGSRCAYANDERENYADHTLGFRCCLSIEEAEPEEAKAAE